MTNSEFFAKPTKFFNLVSHERRNMECEKLAISFYYRKKSFSIVFVDRIDLHEFEILLDISVL